ncbi:hypothetical protein [Kitasatospora sp. NPDC056531]|uniref:hypothetical protein n=1 Tax=Kitasatospora sp. NPDC056531 TaxID=3345856 RepID=UPI003695B013
MTDSTPEPRPPRPSLAEAARRRRPGQPRTRHPHLRRPHPAPPPAWWPLLTWISWSLTVISALGWPAIAVLKNSYQSMDEGWSSAEGDRLIYLPMLAPVAGAVLAPALVLTTSARRWGFRAMVALAGVGSVVGWLGALGYGIVTTAR